MLLQLEAENTVNTYRFCIDYLSIVFAHHNTVLKLQKKFQLRGSVSCRFICSSYYYLLLPTATYYYDDDDYYYYYDCYYYKFSCYDYYSYYINH